MPTQKVKVEEQGGGGAEDEVGGEETSEPSIQEGGGETAAYDDAENGDGKSEEADSGEGRAEGDGNEGLGAGYHQFEDADTVPSVSAAQQPLNKSAPSPGGDRGADTAAALSTLAYYQAMTAAASANNSTWQGAGASTFEVPVQHSTHHAGDLSHQTSILPSSAGVLSPTVPAWGAHQAYAAAAASTHPTQYSIGAAATAGPPVHDLSAVATYAAAPTPVLSVANASSEHYEWWAKYYQQYYQLMAYRGIPGIPPPPPPNPWTLPSCRSTSQQLQHQSQQASLAMGNNVTIPIDMVPPRSTPPKKRQRVGDGGGIATGSATRTIGTSSMQMTGDDDDGPLAQEDRDDAVNSLTKMYQC
jgi:hypothetical protein